jgi:hypothetical protein
MENLTTSDYPEDIVMVDVYPEIAGWSPYVCIEASSGERYVHVHVDLDRLVRVLREGGADL